MLNTSKPILFFGTDYFSLHVLKALIHEGYSIHAVITKPDSHQGRGQKLTGSPVKQYAEAEGIEVWQPQHVGEVFEKVKALDHPAGVLVSYGQIIPADLIDLFQPGIINIHPSLLPKYRGPTPFESVILNGDEKTGISIMKLSSRMDAGPVYHQVEVPLSGTETKTDVEHMLTELSAIELIKVLPSILDGSLEPKPQHDGDATYCSLLDKSDAHINPEKLAATQAERHVRAYIEFPRTKIAVNGHDVIITKAHVADEGNSPLDIRFQDGQYLSIDELVGPSGRKMSAKDFLNGYAAG